MTALLFTVLALASPAEEFEQAKIAYGRGEYQRAIDLFQGLLYPTNKLSSEANTVEAHKMLGVSHLFRKSEAQAREEFVKLLEIKPEFRFDPLTDLPEVVKFFNEIVTSQSEQLAAIEAAKKLEAARLKAEQDRKNRVEVRYERHSFGVAFVPFGVGQFQNGDTSKGQGFLIGETLLGTTSLSLFVANFALYGLHRQVDPGSSDRDWSQRLKWGSFGLGIAFWGLAGWGIWDAVKNFKPEVQIETQPGVPGPERLAPRASAFDLQPVFMGQAVGLGGRF